MSFDYRKYADTPQEFLAKLESAEFIKANPNNQGIVGKFVLKPKAKKPKAKKC